MERFAAAWLGLLLASCLPVTNEGPDHSSTALELPTLGATAYHSIAARIFANETQSQTRYLTYWGAGEDFPSLGIGHFIWFPKGVDAPFDETFPSMMQYVKEHSSECSSVPVWLEDLQSFVAPWQSKAEFDEAQESAQITELRQWLVDTASEQAHFIVVSFADRWNELDLPAEEKQALTALLQRLVQTSQGLSAVVDYYNFKGLGSNPRERYNGEGWGLVQVLTDVSTQSISADATDLVEQFSTAAANRLRLRVKNAPPERNEARWLEGWERRVADYTAGTNQFAGQAASRYRVTPYLQNPSPTGMTLVWFSDRETAGEVTIRSRGPESTSSERKDTSAPARACELSYHLAEYRNLEEAQTLPFRHVVELDGLQPGNHYAYEVLQDGELASGEFRTPSADSEVRFVVYGDSETEPESVGKHAAWSVPGDPAEKREYLVDQSAGYSANLDVIATRRPDFVAIAGDLVQSGGEQRDWDEFWRHNASLAATAPIIAAAGNHDYFGGPGDLGLYSDTGSRRAIAKFQSYFPTDTYYAVDYGPVVLVVIDANSGSPDRSAEDTNWYLDGKPAGGVVPAWQAGSAQAKWLEKTLASAQQGGKAAFVVFHPAPYTSGVHGLPPGVGDAENFSSGLPLRALTPTFLRYGVAAVFNGHDEIYEHSTVAGRAVRADGSLVDHTVHFFTIGIGGDGLRGAHPAVANPHREFLAHTDAKEVFDNGVLVAGGKHYGHLEVNLQVVDGIWQARIEPVYVFPLMNNAGEIQGFERRVYDDVTILEGLSEH